MAAEVALSTFVLVYSPLAAPLTWPLVADDLRKRGMRAIVPALPDVQESRLAGCTPNWSNYAEPSLRPCT
ncbi:MAG: hypothetical protein M3014_04390 [Chloroflexota bacterium]|nr:hypothetical protein [Chloroflexota bacterium]